MSTCQDCLTLAVDSAYGNWEDANGRPALESSDIEEVHAWAAYYVESGDSSPCNRCEESKS